MNSLFLLAKNIRFYILLLSLAFALLALRWTQTFITGSSVELIRLEEIYGFTSLFFLYFSLLAGPLCYRFPHFPGNAQFLKARRALGVSAFFFAFLHSYITFFKQLGGFNGLNFLPNAYLFSISFGIIGLFILLLLTLTSLDKAVSLMRFRNWKLLHRLVYCGGILILLHIVLIGSHFGTLSGVVAQITLFAIGGLLLLEAPRIDSFVGKRFTLPLFGSTTMLVVALLFTYVILSFLPANSAVSLSIHAQHIQLAKDAAQNQFVSSNFPGLQGDRTLRYTVTFSHPDASIANTDIPLTLRVYNASNGIPVAYFKTPYEKPMHMIIVNNNLTYFAHIHPTQTAYDFAITTQFPKDDIYHIYVDFQPFGAIEQQDAFSLTVGSPAEQTTINDFSTKKTFGNYEVSLDTHGQLFASQLSFGEQILTFTLRDATTHQPITTLRPYLAAFGHLVMINTTTFDYVHVHPTNLTSPLPNQTSGPSVDFLPIGIYGPIKPGIYKIFAQFNPDGNLFTADFVVKIL